MTATGFPTPTLIDTGTLPSGVSFNASTGVLSGTPAPGTVGTYNVTFTASNSVGAAAALTFTLTVSKANQTITLMGMPSSALFGQGPFILSASATSGLTVTLSANGNCLLSSNSLSLTGVGSCTVSAAQAGDGSKLWEDAMKSLNRPNAFSGAFLFSLFLFFSIGGILLVWVYAAIRPRFGAGVRTAVYAGLVAWAFAGLLPNMMNAVTGLYSPRLMFYSTLADIVEVVVGAIVGAALYKEEESTA